MALSLLSEKVNNLFYFSTQKEFTIINQKSMISIQIPGNLSL